jgi:hypothetical protein
MRERAAVPSVVYIAKYMAEPPFGASRHEW